MRRELASRLRIIQLFDTYGRLLSARQRHLLRLYYHDDLSLGEIAERQAVTRQAVFDVLRRSTEEMERLEHSLQLVAARRQVNAQLDVLAEAVRRLGERVGAEAVAEVESALAALRRAAG
ncbi:MAG TPA: sigma factor-like helix-turn-helix DNA-binding protein [Candidatus Tectomicrobia bacterium]|nr:sigma factor-like helix-turn-helix DNA-binding protein [Candidatus Tectomicrobia bacterium]